MQEEGKSVIYIFSSTCILKADCSPAYSHITDDGEPVTGHLVQRPCPACIKIYAPVDPSIKKAIIVLTRYHNHPMPAVKKVPQKGRDMDVKAVKEYGVTGASAVKVDSGEPLL